MTSINICEAQSLRNLKEINTVWNQFYIAFNTLNHQTMAYIHSEALIRISGGRTIIDYQTYISNYKNQFQAAKSEGTTYDISLRFFERINTNTTASERGVYRLIINKEKPDEQTYYGQFHVIMKKENGDWKITMDYDSTEFDTIDEKSYLKAHAITDFEAFLKQ
ncbi:nuclear transport factor 2 family protein [Psychroserpens sp. SPM9]|uniref:nuclear transport factor 2 family protein n=1 Tax=Psychroserpens sp. SPM9 TaxID=2975598 RepID=UPI0021A48B47|nr:nuclear transport factor 2 family protein [Psychroserpens sp. SPM9]MDG5492070.1 nuclear transport factor 2 family protein [Psychroserpens sp. SPM9]